MRFLHTADWQIGMTRRFLRGGDQGAQALYDRDRLAAVRRLGEIAGDTGCAFLLVCGDVFEDNAIRTATVARALDAMAASPVPVYLLPGNHDPYDPGSVYRQAAFERRRPEQVHVLAERGVHQVAPGIEIVAAPWPSKRPLRDLPADALAAVDPAPPGTVRVLAGHGAVDSLNPDRDDPAAIRLAGLERALADGLVHYVALGDRHSATAVTERVRYAGTPEVTAYDEQRPGLALVVDVDQEHCQVTEHAVGRWRFRESRHRLRDAADVQALHDELSRLPDKDRTAVKLRLDGGIDLATAALLDDRIAEQRDLFAAVEIRDAELTVLPEDADLDLTGFARTAFEELRDAGTPAATDAVRLLHRIAGGGAAR